MGALNRFAEKGVGLELDSTALKRINDSRRQANIGASAYVESVENGMRISRGRLAGSRYIG